MTWKTNKNFDLSTYLQELVEESSQTKSSDTESLGHVKSSSTPETCSFKDKKTDASLSFRSGMTSEHLTESLGGEQLTFLQEDSLVKTSQQQEKGKGLRESALDYGANTRDLLERCNLSLSSPKTAHYFALEDLEPSCKTLPTWGIMQGGECLGLGTLEQHIDGIEFGYWATPNARDYKDSPGQSYIRKDGKMRLDQTPRQIYGAGKGLFTPPTASTSWGTVSSLNAKSAKEIMQNANAQDLQWMNGTTKSGTESSTQDQEPIGQANVEFSEWLMGFPVGWTDLKPLEMDKCPNAQLWRGDC